MPKESDYLKSRSVEVAQRFYMKKILSILCLGLFSTSVGFSQAPMAPQGSEIPPQLLKFSAAKEQQARQLAADFKVQVSPEIWAYFKYATQGDWLGVTNTYARLKLRSGQYEGSVNDPAVSSPVWQTLIEVQTAYDAFTRGGTKYPLDFGEGIIQSIPAGSIYFGGTDPGRGLVTALCESHAQAKPFFTLTQNALAEACIWTICVRCMAAGFISRRRMICKTRSPITRPMYSVALTMTGIFRMSHPK